ncbi:hypothetical protein [Gloeothece verrucosa]|uniref:Uncharacterized protein n=1 Tax=Gloeothece verrucosa (strain PCC 7822) TaxID=497965 RepID=E0UL95_GLOV7|nr:hypothetical protein [Gloeothece verrucosa]ADN17725.1 hypothetical protein Cyan7822_5871 [Gloeothece verrucosa PCC 7822]
MLFLLFKSELVAREVAWQLRAISIKKLVILYQTDTQALKLAIALAGGKCVKSWRLFSMVSLITFLFLICFRVIGEFNHPDELKIFTEDGLTHFFICNNQSFGQLQLAINCENKLLPTQNHSPDF